MGARECTRAPYRRDCLYYVAAYDPSPAFSEKLPAPAPSTLLARALRPRAAPASGPHAGRLGSFIHGSGGQSDLVPFLSPSAGRLRSEPRSGCATAAGASVIAFLVGRGGWLLDAQTLKLHEDPTAGRPASGSAAHTGLLWDALVMAKGIYVEP